MTSIRKILIILGIAGFYTPTAVVAQSYANGDQGQQQQRQQPQQDQQQRNSSVVQPWGQSFGDLPLPIQTYRAPATPDELAIPGGRPQIQSQQGTTYSGKPKVQLDEHGQPIFNNDDYLDGIGSGRPPVGMYAPQQFGQPQKTVWTPKPGQLDYQSPFNKGFFEGKVDPNDKMEDLQKFLRVGPLKTHEDPAWAKQKLKMRYFQDGQEHFGNDDPYGFFNQ